MRMPRWGVSPILVVATATLAAVVLGWPADACAQSEAPHIDRATGERFPVGMFSVDLYTEEYDYLDYADPVTMARVDSIWRGNPGGHEACNLLFFYHSWWHRTEADSVIVRVLEPLRRYNRAHPGADLRIVIGPLYWMFVSASRDEDVELRFVEPDGSRSRYEWMDHHLTPALRRDLTEYVRTICEWEEENAPGMVAGWLGFEEPILYGQDLGEYYRLMDAVKEAESGGGYRRHDIYGVIHQAGFIHEVPEDRTGRWVNVDGRIFAKDESSLPMPGTGGALIGVSTGGVGDFVDDRFPTGDGRYDGGWYYTMWEADVVMLEYYGPPHTPMGRNWGKWISDARGDTEERGGRRSWPGDWEIHAILPGLKGYHVERLPELGGRLHTFTEFPRHGDLRNVIRHVADLGVDGIWFYAWEHCCDCGSNTCDGTARHYWRRRGFEWARAVEEEIEGSDQLVVARSETGLSAGIDRQITELFPMDDARGVARGDLGAPVTLGSEAASPCVATACAAGDFDGDGDDELVIAYSDSAFAVNRLYLLDPPGDGDAPPGECAGGIRLVTAQDRHVTAMAAGDLDGDGDDELILATARGADREDARVEVYYHARGRNAVDSTGDLGEPLMLYDAGGAGDVLGGAHATAVAAGDFDGDGTDEIVVALRRSSREDGEIRFLDGIEPDTSPARDLGRYPPLSEFEGRQATAMTAADYDGDVADDLVIAWSGPTDEAGVDAAWLRRYAFGRRSYDDLTRGRLGTPLTIAIDPAPGLAVTALTSGDYDGDRADATLVALATPTDRESAVYLVEDPESGTAPVVVTFPSPRGFSRVTAMASGDFDPSDR